MKGAYIFLVAFLFVVVITGVGSSASRRASGHLKASFKMLLYFLAWIVVVATAIWLIQVLAPPVWEALSEPQ